MWPISSTASDGELCLCRASLVSIPCKLVEAGTMGSPDCIMTTDVFESYVNSEQTVELKCLLLLGIVEYCNLYTVYSGAEGSEFCVHAFVRGGDSM